MYMRLRALTECVKSPPAEASLKKTCCKTYFFCYLYQKNYLNCGHFSIPILNQLISNGMKIYKTKEIKNIALLGSKGSGKTTLAESMLDRKSVV